MIGPIALLPLPTRFYRLEEVAIRPPETSKGPLLCGICNEEIDPHLGPDPAAVCFACGDAIQFDKT